ncbi:MAG TPA: ABC transporter ATP-binding protein [Plantibacter sp.]|uniref:ABC transporter ATP-binding protein n=1 Tax=Plantibacter sp. TaxID=1871045 RepID=UPI002B87BFA5|nr:ABC transporter ATP-binding protein [Plantibacter sp.]
MTHPSQQQNALRAVTDQPLPLVVERLDVGYRSGGSKRPTGTVRDVSFQVGRGETVSLVGQSGSGKSTIARAVAGLLPANGVVTGGRVSVAGHEVAGFSRKLWRPLRGTTLGFVPQDPLSSLDPLQRVGVQIAQAVQVAGETPRSEVPARVVELLEHVGIRQAATRVRAYPHELSGGQLQRVLIAIAIAAGPKLLIADEPTSALDVTVQRRILDLLDGLREELGLGILFITHDLALAQERSDAIVVLQDGDVRESGAAEDVLLTPKHPYTIRLLSDSPASSPLRYRERIRSAAEHLRTEQRGETTSTAAVVEVAQVSKRYGRDTQSPLALDGASLALRPRSIHALVGESGSGKSTLARIVAGLTSFDEGAVTVAGRGLPRENPVANPFARDLQLVYQNPLSAVDPRFTVRQIIEEPLRIHGVRSAAERRRRVATILDQVALPTSALGRRAREVSGGQRQRVALARTLILAPSVLVLDEPTSALDVSVQAQIVELLLDLRDEHALSYLFISHDLGLIRQIADEVTVLSSGRVVESGPASAALDHPQHEYTRELLDAVPRFDVARLDPSRFEAVG